MRFGLFGGPSRRQAASTDAETYGRYVDEVVPSPWLLDEAFLDRHAIDILVHGSDNSNPIDPQRLLILPRTEGVSSSELRQRVVQALQQIQQRMESE